MATAVLQSVFLEFWEGSADRLGELAEGQCARIATRVQGADPGHCNKFIFWFFSTHCVHYWYPGPVKQSHSNQLGFFPWQVTARLSLFDMEITAMHDLICAVVFRGAVEHSTGNCTLCYLGSSNRSGIEQMQVFSLLPL